MTLPLPTLGKKVIGDIEILTDETLFESARVRIALTGKHTGISLPDFGQEDLDLSRVDGVVQEYSRLNRGKLICALGEDAGCNLELFNPFQVHGDEVCVVSDDSILKNVKADATICEVKNVACMLLFADCCPLVLVADNGIFAVIHAGWRGVVNLISQKTFNSLVNDFGCDANNINAYIGPHLGACCFEVDASVEKEFTDKFGSVIIANRHGDKSFIDMSLALKMQLLDVGLNEKRLCDANICTSCNHDDFFSYRKGDEKRGRQAALAFRC